MLSTCSRYSFGFVSSRNPAANYERLRVVATETASAVCKIHESVAEPAHGLRWLVSGLLSTLVSAFGQQALQSRMLQAVDGGATGSDSILAGSFTLWLVLSVALPFLAASAQRDRRLPAEGRKRECFERYGIARTRSLVPMQPSM